MMVLEYAENGSLRNYLLSQREFYNLKWQEKLYILGNISGNSCTVEIYFNFTNLLLFQELQIYYNSTSSSGSSNVCEVLPYIDPEVLNGKPYTTAK